MDISILALSTAVPSYKMAQEEVAHKLVEILSLDVEKAKVLKQLYQNSAIHTRYSVIPDFAKKRDEWHFWGVDFPKVRPGMSQRNHLYKMEAPKLAFNAAKKALDSWGGDVKAITHVISVSCTGMWAPGIEFELMQKLNLNTSVQRLGINFMGCFGAFKGISVAESFAKENPKNRILVVCTELCSLHFQADQTLDNMLANALFSDGAAAVIVGGECQAHEKSLWKIHNKASLGLENTLDKMSWGVQDEGFTMTLSSKIPAILKQKIALFVNTLLKSDFLLGECDFAIHPGGKAIIQGIERALNLKEGMAEASWETLAHYGNMSSATFLFVLERFLGRTKKPIIGLGFGPGLSIEGLVLT